ncbi:MAG: cytidylate kinase-like family protein [SAR202 cluster bacterium]|nr:cytidylate kinase-like family protein [SAR202 cluster bacterium]
MPVVTINGQIGSGAREIGPVVAQSLGVDYVDRLVLAEAGRRVGASVAALAEKEQRLVPLRQRVSRLLQAALERSASSGGAGDPFFQPSLEALTLSPYPETTRGEPITQAQELDDQRFMEAVSQVIKDLAADNNVVILGRASSLVLKGWPGALHVSTIATTEYCVETMMRREGITKDAATKLVTEQERGRISYFRRFYKADPVAPFLYHLTINVPEIGIDAAARIIVEAANLRAKG